jgi:hypothetical protein
MAQYKDFNGANFGNAHQSDTTYKVVKAPLSDGTPSSGSIYLSGSGGYVNSPTNISKASLDAGINVRIDDNDVTRSIVEVENGTCDGEQAFATWVFPTPTATPTNTPTPTNLAVLSNNNFFTDKVSVASGGGDSSESVACSAIPGGTNHTFEIHKASGNGQSNNYPEVNDTIKYDSGGGSYSAIQGNYIGYSGSVGGAPSTFSVTLNASGVVTSVDEC